MPCCAVQVCGNRSSEANFKTCGVTYHRFPKDPKLKEKWIDACGRKDEWFPTQNGVICSSHFEEKCFQPIAKSRRLFPAAVPTLKLRLVFETRAFRGTEESQYVKMDTHLRTNPGKWIDPCGCHYLAASIGVQSKTSKHKIKAKKIIIKPGEKRSIVERYKVQIEKYKKGMQQQKMHIKRLQTMVRRYRKKADVMKNILTALKNENAIAEDHLWLLESDSVSNSK